MNTLTISCPGNSDWNGTWTKNEVEQSMYDLGLECSEHAWIEWVLDHCIGLLDWRQIEFIMDDSTVAVTVYVDGLLVKIAKS